MVDETTIFITDADHLNLTALRICSDPKVFGKIGAPCPQCFEISVLPSMPYV